MSDLRLAWTDAPSTSVSVNLIWTRRFDQCHRVIEDPHSKVGVPNEQLIGPCLRKADCIKIGQGILRTLVSAKYGAIWSQQLQSHNRTNRTSRAHRQYFH